MLLSIKNFSVAIQEKQVVKSIDLACLPGSVHFIMGPNGSGKSSLVSALMGHPRYEILGGSVHLGQLDILGLSIEKRALAGIFVAFQYPCEIPGVTIFTFLHEAYRSVRKIDITVAEFKRVIEEACHLVGLDSSFMYRYLHDGFSGGEKKRLELIQLIILQPKVAILDELDSGLDADGLIAVGATCAMMKKNHPDMIFIIISHYQKLIDHLRPDYIHIMMQGQLVAQGDVSLLTTLEHQGYHAFLQA
ncbi:MAG: Fe-S cluster assembly ATPase SufC [Candidatus Babeliaceae bacterium]|jgi:Fe-S cluster assembly ATP-binding protein